MTLTRAAEPREDTRAAGGNGTRRSGPRTPAGGRGGVSIGALAREAGVSTRTVRYYEEIGLLRTARRYAGGRRVFDDDALERLRFIGRLKRLGFSLDEISELNDVFALQQSTRAMLKVLDGKLGQHLASLEEQLGELNRMRTELASYRTHVRRRLGASPAEPERAAAAEARATGAAVPAAETPAQAGD